MNYGCKASSKGGTIPSDKTRVILLFDVWNPHLTEVEQLAVTELVAAIAELKGDEL